MEKSFDFEILTTRIVRMDDTPRPHWKIKSKFMTASVRAEEKKNTQFRVKFRRTRRWTSRKLRSPGWDSYQMFTVGAYLNVEKQCHGERRRHGHNLFGGQPVEVDDDDGAADLSLFLHQRGYLNQVEHLEQLFAGECFRVPGRWKQSKSFHSRTASWWNFEQ